MKLCFAFLAIPLVASAGTYYTQPGTDPFTNPMGDALQLVLVVGDAVPGGNDWLATQGQMSRYSRTSRMGAWSLISAPTLIKFGPSGLRWGRGLHFGPLPNTPDPVKKEGDLSSPVGVFQITGTFGDSPPPSTTGAPTAGAVNEKFYTQINENTRCIEDSTSPDYNRVVGRQAGAAPISPGTQGMSANSGLLYKWGLIVGHNTENTVANAGSCVFIHVWRDPNNRVASAGCTVSAEENIRELVIWVKPEAHPVMVQLPNSLYARYKIDWRLP